MATRPLGLSLARLANRRIHHHRQSPLHIPSDPRRRAHRRAPRPVVIGRHRHSDMHHRAYLRFRNSQFILGRHDDSAIGIHSADDADPFCAIRDGVCGDGSEEGEWAPEQANVLDGDSACVGGRGGVPPTEWSRQRRWSSAIFATGLHAFD